MRGRNKVERYHRYSERLYKLNEIILGLLLREGMACSSLPVRSRSKSCGSIKNQVRMMARSENVRRTRCGWGKGGRGGVSSNCAEGKKIRLLVVLVLLGYHLR